MFTAVCIESRYTDNGTYLETMKTTKKIFSDMIFWKSCENDTGRVLRAKQKVCSQDTILYFNNTNFH